jgi:hypothetical protein
MTEGIMIEIKIHLILSFSANKPFKNPFLDEPLSRRFAQIINTAKDTHDTISGAYFDMLSIDTPKATITKHNPSAI